MTEDIHYTAPDGLKLFARAYGRESAPLNVLCMHGLTRNHKDFEPMIAALGDRWRFIAVDVRGRGRSAWDPDAGHYAPPVYVQDMKALLDHLGIERAALIGTSMGGLMAMLMMKTMPERVAGVVLNDIGPAVDKAGLRRIGGYVGKSAAPVADWESAARAVAAVQGPLFPGFTHDDWLDFAKRTFRQQDDGRLVLDYDPAIAASLGKVRAGPLMRFAMWRLFRAMSAAPLLVIRGQLSDILGAKTVDKMLHQHPDASAVTVPNVGHAPVLNEPEALSAIAAFLQRIGPSTGQA